jgi:amino acid adenylation domain-containing protein/non-ribosomal peptide synthase protein (TIGR01720 family)
MALSPIEDTYPLSPMQEGMLFHALYAPRAGVDVEQMVCALSEPLEPARFSAAWSAVTAARPVLRTAFRWQGLDEPLQDVHRAVETPWLEEDLRALSPAAQEARFSAFLADDRARGFDLACPPLQRLALFRTGDERYRFVWTFHHILLDGRSFPLVIDDVFAAYAALGEGRAPELPERRPYKDFIAWLRERDDRASLDFWRELLAGFRVPTPLLGGHGEARSVEDIDYGERSLRLSRAETAALVDLGRRHRLHLATLLQGAWSLLLARYAGEAEVVFGSTRAGRRSALGGAGTEAMLGVFINTLPVRVPVPGSASLLPWLAELQAGLRAQRDHEHTPLVKIHAESEVPKSSPLFDTLFVFEEKILGTVLRRRGGPWEGRDFRIVRKTNFPLFLMAYGEDELLLEIEFDRRRFDDATAERMLGHLVTVLRAFLADPERRLADVPVLTEAERELLLVTWNATAEGPPPRATLPALFQAQVDRTPDAVALVDGHLRLTYAELERRVNRLAHHLRARGVGVETRVGLCADRSADLVVALLAVLTAGGAYVPLDPAYPPSRLVQILDDARVSLLVTQQRVRDRLPAETAPTVLLDAEAVAAASDARPPSEVGPDHLAYVIYTSGSTGRPKGVAIEHHATAALIAWAERVYQPAETAGVLFATSICFDLSLFEIFLPLCTGQKLILADNALALPALPARDEVTLINTVPTAMAELCRTGGVPASVRTVCLAGEPLPAALAREVYAIPHVERLYNLYGPTEDTTYSTWKLCPRDGSAPTIGRPLAWGEAFILDARLAPVPIGVVGEIYLGGEGLARGYLGRPDLTAERFLPSPFREGARLYKTGDLGRYLPDGDIEYLGRADFQVKVRGFRIELGEIESVLLERAGVRECVVVARQDTPGDKRIVAYVAPAALSPSAVELRAVVKDALPEYMVPSAFVLMAALPLTPNGKIDRGALPAPDDVASAAPAHAAPRGPVEEALAGIFAEVLRLPPERVGAHDGFFELGGHSLLAAQAITRVRATFGADLPVRALFDASTVAELAALLADASRDAGEPAPPLVREAGAPVLSFAQQRLWVLDQLEPGDPSYVIFRAVRLRGALDRGALGRAIAEIVRRHEALRTTVRAEAGVPVLTVHEGVAAPLPLTDLSAHEDREAALRAALDAEARRPFDLAQGPLLRARLFALAEAEHVLVIAVHHIVADGWSLGVIDAELSALYAAFAKGDASPLAELPLQYADYARWQRRVLQGARLERDLGYWRDRLRGAPLALDLPTDRPRPPVESHRGARLSFAVPPALARALRDLSRREGVTLFMTLLAAFDVLLHRHTGQDDLLVGTPAANRGHAEVEKLVGLFLDTLVLRAEIAPAEPFRALLQRVRETTLGAYAHQDMPFERLVQELAPERDQSRSPLFQVMFTLQNASSGTFTLPGLDAAPEPATIDTSKFDLTLILTDHRDTLAGFFEYATDLFDASTIARLADRLTAILAYVVASPEAPVQDIPVLTLADREALARFNATAHTYGEERPIHALFLAQAEETPDAVALRFEGQDVTYAGLAARASQLAHALQKLGVGPEVLVGVFCERSIELLVALYGTLLAGGAYVPLDPEYPKDRLAFMLDDARPKVILTQAHLTALLPEHGAELLELDAAWPRIAGEPSTPPAVEASLDALAYVIYTSGSTGKPKGAMNAHRGIQNRLLWMQRAYGLTAADVVLQKTPYSFDVSVWELFWPLMNGAKLVVARPEGHRDPAYLASLIASEGVTTLHFVPSMLGAFLDEPSIEQCTSLRRVLCSGEALPAALAARFFARFSVTELHNLYGPTEAAVDVTAWACQPGASLVPIGRPIDNVQIHILDAQLSPVPVGVSGELYIAGVQVGRGYLNRAELTSERFVADPFAGGAARMYRTGDVARWLPDGSIEYLGRADFQVKLRGFRIELGEIEAALLSQPEVREAVVVAREDRAGQKRLVAYLAGSAAVAELRAALKAQLPEYMVPSAFVVLPALPLTQSGKIDRRALPAPEDGAPAEASAAYAAPTTPAEEALSRIWAAVLRLPRVGVHDNFFEVGGDSILGIQIVARAQQVGLALTPRHVFQHQTIAELARVAGSTRTIDAEQGPVVGPVELPPIARWWLEPAPRGASHFNQAFLLEPTEPLDAAALEAALGALLDHHDALRLRLEGGAATLAAPGAPPPFTHAHLAHLPEDERALALARALADAQASLDLSRGPLLRATLFELGATQRVHLVIHHLAVDGVSWRILFDDLATAYAQRRRGEAIALRPKTTSIRRWVERLAEHARSEAVLAEADRWAGLTGARLPTDHLAGENTEASTSRLVVELSAEETEALLREVPEAYGTQINDVLLTALAEAVSAWTGSPDVLVDLEGHGREDLFDGLDVTRTIGWFTALYPVALHHDRGASPGERLRSVKEQLRAVPARGLGHGLLRHLGPADVAARLAKAERPEIIFNYLGQVDQVLPEGAPLRLAPEPAGPTQSPDAVRPHLVEVIGRVTAGKLAVRFTYSENRHARATIDALADGFLGALRALVVHASSPEAGGYTPSDFRRVRLAQSAIDALATLAAADGSAPRGKNVEDLYPLSPLQQGILFHTLVSTRKETYVVQLQWMLEGYLDAAAFARAFQAVVDRHAILRSGVVWEKLDAPLQLVRKVARLAVTEVDLRHLPAVQQDAEVARLVADDRRAGFDVRRAPLLRIALLRLRDDATVLVWSMHHLILDGWSLPLLTREVFAFYEAYTAGRDLRLPTPRPYGDYLDWLGTQDRAAERAFWRAQLHDVTAPTPLGVDRPPQDGAEERFGEVRLVLDDDDSAALTAYARRHRLTPSTVVQGALALLLARYSGEPDVVFGTTVSGRSAPLSGIDTMIGLLINTIPVRVAVPPDERAGAWLSALQDQQAELRSFEHTALVDAQAESSVPRGTPLFEVLFVFENYPLDDSLARGHAGLAVTSTRSFETPAYPLTVVAVLRRALTLRLGFDLRRFDAPTVERLGAHLLFLLRGLVCSPEARLAELPILSDAERDALVHGPNQVELFPVMATVHRRFEAQAERAPAAIAAVFEGRALTYRELDERGNQLAHLLIAHGIGPGRLVGLCAPRSLSMLVGIVGILKAGGAYLPLDPDYPKDRLAFMMADAAAPVLLTLASLGEIVPAGDAVVILLDTDEATLAAQPKTRPITAAGPEDLAYVIYTSGSTGKPKGAMVTHANVVRLFDATDAWYGFGAGDVWTMFHSYAFDVSVWEIWGALLYGGRLVIVPYWVSRSPEVFHELLGQEGVTVLNQTPSAFRQLVRVDESASPEARARLRLRYVIFGGEALDVADLRPWWDLHGDETPKLVNMYGITETTVHVTYRPVSRADLANPTSSVIGRPIPDLTLDLLDAERRPVPLGVTGEIYVGGAGVARGYLRRPELTAERFIADPFRPGGTLYKSGDLGRRLPSGDVEYLGRADFQVKIRGFRVELGEIEAALEAQEAVREAVVLVREDAPGDKRLVAYLVPAGALPEVAELRAALKQRLPDHMVPAAFVSLPALPLTENGKVDRRALPAPEPSLPSADAFVAPRGPLEQAVADVFAAVLKLGRVGASDGFFELGGHSLLATQAVSRLRAALGVDLPLRALFEHPTPAELALVVAEALLAGRGDEAPPLVRAPRDADLVPSFGQERLWFLAQLDPGDLSWVVTFILRFAGALDVPALERALREIVRRHEVLRTTFTDDDGRARPVLHGDLGLALPVTPLPHGGDVDEAIRAVALAEARRPFDLRGPLVRAKLAQIAPGDHVFFLAVHHVVFDAWSFGVLNRELGALYTAYHAGRPSPLPELSVQYADYAAWQRAWLAGPVLDRQLAYWKDALAGAPTSLDLPADRPRPPVRSSRGAQLRFALGAPLTRALHDLSRREGVTLFMTLLAAYDVLLYRYTGQDDLLVGSPVAGRARAETEALIGFFINTLVLRARLDGALAFPELLQRVRDACLGAYAHQDTPFERLVKELHPEPDPSRSPLFQVIFNLQNTPVEAVTLPDVEVRRVDSGSVTVKVDLTLIMFERQGALHGLIEYATDLFDHETVERFAAHFRALLEGIVENPARAVSRLPILGDDERERLLHGWNDTALAFPEDDVVHRMFEATVDRTPEATAVIAGAEELSFRQLDVRANRLARHLRSLGVGAESIVGLCMDRTLGAVIGILGILKAGAAYVPLDPDYPKARLAQILAEAGSSLVVTRDALADAVHVDGVRRVRLDGDAFAIDMESGARLPVTSLPSHLCYVLFTSGSTGKPKGVAIEHKNLANYVRGIATRLGLPEGATYAHVSTFSADLGNTSLYPPLCLGGTLHVVPDELTRDPDGIAAYFHERPVDLLKLAPTHLAALLGGAHPERVLPRQIVVVGGEGLTWELVERVERLAPGVRILNHYAPTECTCGVLTYPVLESPRPATPIAPLGRPLPNGRVYILDQNQEPVPTGVPGEVFVGGAQVGRGYLGRPDLTAERFLRDPFVPDPAARMYRSGDRARFLPDGSVMFLGRVDHQVKIRGFRIELGEIEAALAAHPAVRESIVVVQEPTPGDRRLAAFVVPRGEEVPSPSELRAHLAAALPDYMVPAQLRTIATIPLNANGKIDRAALLALADEEVETEELTAPRTPVEEVLAGIWADVFERERVSVHDRFADLGGHSLLAIQIIARARVAFQVEIPLRAIFEAPTVAALAERVEAARAEGLAVEAPPVTRVPRDAPLPLSFSQERLWFLDQLEPGSAAYNVPIGMRLGGALDAQALERALLALCRRHEVLRTTFTTVAGKPVQVIHAEPNLRLALDDLSALPAAAREDVARREAEVEAQRPFDLAKGPLVRARLLRLAEDDHVLLLTLHHIVSDAWTRGILAKEIAALYVAGDEPITLRALPIQYADYAAWQRAFLQGPVLDELLAYWKKQLVGAPAALELPTDRPRPPVQSGRGGRRFLDLPVELGRALHDLARRENATPFMALLAGFYALLHRYTGQDDISIGTPVANRARPETEGLIGFFVNTLVLRAQMSPETSYRELLARVREACLSGYAHQELPFERLVSELAPERDLSRPPLFQVMFAYQAEPTARIDLHGLTMRPMSGESGTSKFDLILGVTESARGLHALIEFATDLFDPSTIERMLGHLTVLLEGIVKAPDARLADLPLLPAAERHQLLAEWNVETAAHPRGLTAHGWFERQVDRTPDAPAATYEGKTLSYRQLDARANQVAHFLRKRGVGPDVLVGLSTERSMDMLVGLLGILKAGGAYLPLDPEYPKDRLAFMAEDAKVSVVLTQAKVAEVLPVSAHAVEKVRLDADWATIAEEPSERLPSTSTPDNLAYVIYTSGSTGKPKGVMVEHYNVVRLFEATDPWYGFGPSDVWTMFHSYAFDFSVWEIWGALFYGGRVVIVPYWVSRNPEAFHELLGKEKVTVLSQTPSAFRQLVRVDEEAGAEARARLALRYVIFGGEALDLGDLRPWWAHHADTSPQLVNMYGITETTVHVTYRPVGLADLERPWSSVIGRAIPDLSVYILDKHRKLAPIGVPGEMFVGGAGVARGYLHRAELTAERFIDDPFRAGARLYKTGDLARYLANGDIEYLGRIDHQVKIRGFRIELGEIEAVLDAHPAVREAVVLAREDGPGEKRLVAYLVCREGEAPTAAELRAYVKQSLPDMMVPAAFVLLDALPLTANGKVDRRALPAPEEGERAAAGSEYAAPSSPAEEELSRIWAAALRLPKVGVHDNFFELGGDSILSIQIVARAREAGLHLTPRQIFQHQTIAELAAAAGTLESVSAEQGAVVGPVPITPVQRWWLDQDVADPHHHNQAIFLEVREELDREALTAAIAALLEHHDMLRVRVTREGGRPAQSIAPPGGPAPLTHLDLSHLHGDELTAAIEREAAAAQASLDLALGPAARVVHFDLGPASPGRLLFVVHHMGVDGVSWRILLEDLWSAYEQADRGEAIKLSPKTTSFQRWAERLAEHARSDEMRDEEAFWLGEGRADVGHLPGDGEGDNLEGAARAVVMELTQAETEQLLREVPEVYRTQVNDILLTAWAQAASAWTGARRVLVDLEGHGREEIFADADVTRTVGWFTAIYPVVLDLDPHAGPGEAIMSVKEQLRAIPGRGLGYGLLRYLREGEAVSTRLAALPRAEVSFNYLGQFDQALPDSSPFSFAKESLGPGYSPRAARPYLLDVQGSVRGGKLRVRLAFSEGRLQRESIEQLGARLLEALRGLIAHCLSPVAGGYTPSDFQKADLSQEEIGDLLDQLDDEE